MPSVSEAQHKAMEAAAHGHSTLGIPESVGKEFVAEDDHLLNGVVVADTAKTKAAGILFQAGDKILFIKRGNGGAYPGTWAFPAGTTEDGETAEQTAIRETLEETGYVASGLNQISTTQSDGLEFTTFHCNVAEFVPILCNESTDAGWFSDGEYPEPLHPGVAAIINNWPPRIEPKNELDIAREMASGLLSSPQKYENVWLFSMRITGTGVAYRSGIDQFCFRNPADYLNENFLARCNGLPVIIDHPDKKTLDSQEYADRTVGSIFLPFLKPAEGEVWGIAKIYDAAAAQMMEDNQLSTSPTVVTREHAANSTITLDDGATLLIEGKPSLLDHLAICELGVWDKGGPPSGVSTNNSQEINQMNEDELKAKADAEAAEAEKVKADAESDSKLDKILALCDSLSTRMDSFEKTKADAEVTIGEPKQVAADAEEEKAKADKAKADAEEEEEKAKAKADAEDMRKKIADMDARMPKEMTDADYAEMADAQAKADGVFSAFGDSAPAPTRGQSLMAYRKSLAHKLKGHSQAWKEVDIYALHDSVVGIAEAQIYSDAAGAALSPVDLPVGTLRTIEKRNENGQTIRTFVGDPNAWMGEFKGANMKQMSIYTERGAK